MRNWVKGQRCHYCGNPAEDRDHVQPRAVTSGNRHLQPGRDLVAACRPCNNFKGARTPEQFLEFLQLWYKKHPKTQKHSVLAIRSLGWKFWGEVGA